ncbi:MAG: hypothetical protein IJJ26_03100 [Victivallales bacterium]|nr:hypothetical protein [Victivallales bacterium]
MKPKAKKRQTYFPKPCMTNLPPELGRRIFEAILNPPPFDQTKRQKRVERGMRELARVTEEIKRYETATK